MSKQSASLVVEKLDSKIVCRTLIVNKNPVATLVSPAKFRFNRNIISEQSRYLLSRFALIRRSGNDLILESPLSAAHLILHDKHALLLIAALKSPFSYSDTDLHQCGFNPQTVKLLFTLLQHAGALSVAGSENRSSEETDRKLMQWEFHDLLFHSRSRTGRHLNPYGKTDPFKGIVEPMPAVKKYRGRGIKLYKPDLEKLKQIGPAFTNVLERRRSNRVHKKPSIHIREIGELLFRSARIKEFERNGGYEITKRVYPGSGAVYALEIYLAINRAAGIKSGLYHYCPLNHSLFRISGKTSIVQSLLHSAAKTAHTSIPQVLMIISARFQRMTWRYQSVSYSSLLKDVGCLYQTIYLVAAAMGISACALGVGNSDLFSKAAKTDYYEETSVGEFIIGR